MWHNIVSEGASCSNFRAAAEAMVATAWCKWLLTSFPTSLASSFGGKMRGNWKQVGAKCRKSFSSLNWWWWQENLTICRGAHLGRRLPKLNWSRNTLNSNSMQQPRTSAQKQRCQSSQFNNSRTTWISSCYRLNHPISTSKPCPNQGNKLQTYPQTRLPGCHINICRGLLMKVLGAVWSWKMELDLQDWFFPHIQQL